jgi:uncharacterized protein (DUF849 family)
MRGRYDPIVLTAAITGGDVFRSQSPHIPAGATAIVAEALGAAAAGAACIHVHAREEADGRPTGSPELFAEIAAGIRAGSDAVISFTTGGSPGMSTEERFASLAAGRPDIATFNLGTMNYEGYPTPSRWPAVEHDWEQRALDQSGDVLFVNTLNTMRRLAATCRDLGITPELEAYDMGHLSMARFLIDEGTLEPPVRLQLVLGVLGGADNSLETLFQMREAAIRILGADLESLSVAATGYPMQFRHVAAALGLGMHCRVGLEDSLRVRRDRRATSNAELVEVVVQLADLLGRPLSSPAELRAELGPWGGGS